MVVHFGKVIRRLHESLGIPQAHIAKKVGMETSNYNTMLNRKDMKCSTFFTVCEAIGCDIRDIHEYFSECEEKQSSPS